MFFKSSMFKFVSGIIITILITNISFAASPAQQYKDALYEKYLESLEMSRDSYLNMIKMAKKNKIEKSQWIDSACVRINEINKILGDVKDSTCCIKKDTTQIKKK
jgi:hypothetical protein